MFIDTSKNNGKDYIRLAESNRVQNEKGHKVARKTVVLNIGPLDKFDDGQPDYLVRLRKSFRAGEPLIPALQPYCAEERPREKYTFTFEEGNPDCIGTPKLYSHLFLERILEELGLRNLFSSYKGFTKIEYDVYGFAKLLIFGRLLNPASKIATVRQNEAYHEKLIKDFNPDNVCDTLGFIAAHKDKIIRRMNTSLVKKAHRRPEIIYYDVTNFYFEIPEPDDDELDEEGNVLEKGLRKMGVCKEERKLPIVQMGLFMDDKGVPIALESFPGNTLDHLTMLDALKKNIDGIDFTRFIMIGDRGICTYPNLLHLLDKDNGYIVAKSLLKSTAKEREWTYSEDEYEHKGTGFKYKSRIVDKKVTDENGVTRTINEKVVVYWSENFEKRSIAENKSFLEFIAKLIESPANFRVTAAQAKSLRKFFRKEVVNDKTGEVFNSADLKVLLDMDKIEQHRKSMGYYQIVTSELELGALEVIDKYHGLSRIEDQFRVMKGPLCTRPIFLRNPDHIAAHLLICMIALIMMRIIQNRIVESGLVPSAEEKGGAWTAGLPAERIQLALGKWMVDKMPNDYYRFLNTGDPDLKLLLDAFNISIPNKMYQRGELKSIKTGTQIFMQARPVVTSSQTPQTT
ncbi:MAG: IS1634 family transposase [Dehalococcoidia bacterium]|nr:IS1634 family transposase [Dehalococcoidia bacterium]